jgi:predicted GNAT family acetyltransferase
MAWFITEDLDEYATAAEGFLRSRPVAHTVPLTIIETLRAGGWNVDADDGLSAPLYGWWSEGNGVTGAFLQTPPHPVLLSGMPEPAIETLPDALTSVGRSLPGVTATNAAAEGFAAAWQRRTGKTFQVRQRQRLYRLGELVPPRPAPPGAPRVVAAPDRDLLLAWHEAFIDEADAVPGRSGAVVDDRLTYGGLTLWEVDGEPVSMAGRSRLVAGMTRVAPVYTPLAHRRRGYAAAVTATVSQDGLDAGASEVLLFTDLANPTSNSVYQRIGYRPVDDFLVVTFGD